MLPQDRSLKIDRSVKTLRELTLEKMRDAIFRLYFKPGERLVERTLCDQLGVSRSVVREVLRHLEAEGLVETVPHQGPIVARLDADKTAQIYELRALLESHAARACAERADDATVARLGAAVERMAQAFAAGDSTGIREATTTFYEELFAGSGKAVAWDIVQSLNARINHLRAMTISTPGRYQASFAEIMEIYEAVKRRDPDAAYAASARHVQNAAAIAMRLLAEIDPAREA
ncbi:MAG TPA: GntR family transcriptional regulator [Nevskiales bacterium]|nr:GntR family transcriptional regulator [Nevskiales bacterium]